MGSNLFSLDLNDFGVGESSVKSRCVFETCMGGGDLVVETLVLEFRHGGFGFFDDHFDFLHGSELLHVVATALDSISGSQKLRHSFEYFLIPI